MSNGNYEQIGKGKYRKLICSSAKKDAKKSRTRRQRKTMTIIKYRGWVL